MAMTCDASLLSLIETASDLTAALPEIIARSLRIKAQVVEQDPTEQGLRRVLNFGHTLGHAIESCAGGELLHGECVALGMVPMCAPPLRPRLTAILQRCGLPTRSAAAPPGSCGPICCTTKKRPPAPSPPCWWTSRAPSAWKQ